MIFQFTDTHSPFLNDFPNDLVSTGLAWIGAYGPDKHSWPFGHLFLCLVFIACTSEENGICHTAALYVRETSIRILTKMEMGV
jgi:hypothetical protein